VTTRSLFPSGKRAESQRKRVALVIRKL